MRFKRRIQCFALLVLFLFEAAACTRGGKFKVGDCVQESGDDSSDTFLITQASGEELYGIKYINTEQGNETVELDRTVGYKKVACPDTKHPTPEE